MKLSLAEVATVLGKSERQVRYMIRLGRLRSEKADGKWTIEEADLPLTAKQRGAMAGRVDTARAAFERAVAPAEKASSPARGRVYSVTRLMAFQQGESLYREVRRTLGATAATDLLFAVVGEINEAMAASWRPPSATGTGTTTATTTTGFGWWLWPRTRESRDFRAGDVQGPRGSASHGPARSRRP